MIKIRLTTIESALATVQKAGRVLAGSKKRLFGAADLAGAGFTTAGWLADKVAGVAEDVMGVGSFMAGLATEIFWMGVGVTPMDDDVWFLVFAAVSAVGFSCMATVAIGFAVQRRFFRMGSVFWFFFEANSLRKIPDMLSPLGFSGLSITHSPVKARAGSANDQ